MKPTFYCSLLYVMSVNTCLIYRCLSSALRVIRSWFIYERQKSTAVSIFKYSRNPTCEIPPCLWISNRKHPPCPPNSIIVNPLPFGNPKRRLWYRYGYFLESSNIKQIHRQWSGFGGLAALSKFAQILGACKPIFIGI